MACFADTAFLRERQYNNASNLKARMQLHERYSTNHYGWHRWVFDHFINLSANSKILELGCGSGDLWVKNRERIPTDVDPLITYIFSIPQKKLGYSLPSDERNNTISP